MSKKFFIVDDNAADRFLITEMIHTSFPKAEVTATNNGVEALEKLVWVSPDFIFLDLDMPEMDGFEFLEAYQRIPSLRDDPAQIYMLTGAPAEYIEKKLVVPEGLKISPVILEKPLTSSRLKSICEKA